jgi:hypothetical protein
MADKRRVELFPLLSGLVLVAIGTLTLLSEGGARIDVGWAASGLLLAVGCLGLALSIRGQRKPPIDPT